MNDIETLNKLIVAAKEQNDDVLVDLYEKAINRILEQERNKEKPVEENIPEKTENIQQDKAIKKVAKGEVSTIVVYEDGKLGWESKYLDIPAIIKAAPARKSETYTGAPLSSFTPSKKAFLFF